MKNAKNVKYPLNQRLGEELIVGDRKTISKMTGFTRDYVRKVLMGVRHNDDIIQAAEQIIQMRETLIKK
jgi:hypothetical protein